MTLRSNSSSNSPANTAMRAAFLKALAKWAERHADTDTITLPTGAVTARELLPVLRAIFSTQGGYRHD